MGNEILEMTFGDIINDPVKVPEYDYKIYLYYNETLAKLKSLDSITILVRLENEESANHSGVALGIILDTEKRKAINPKYLKFLCLNSERDEFPEYFV